VNRASFVVALAAAPAAPSAPSQFGASQASDSQISAELEIKRDTDDLLAAFAVTIAVRNPSAHLVSLDFPTADMYRIDVLRDDGDHQTVWSTAAGHKPLLIARRVDISPGLTRLASQIVDGTTDDRRAYAPGRYVVHVAMLGTNLTSAIDRTIAFNAPISIAQARTTAGGRVVTIAGVPRSEVGIFELRDATGSLRLSRPVGLRPTGTYVVRGYLDAVGDDVLFAVGRFAPAFDNLTDARPKPVT
jgi:hypothetical protein